MIQFLINILKKSLIVDTSKGLGMGSSFVFTGNTKLPSKMAEDFLMHSVNKSNFIDFLSKNFYYLYRGDQIYIVSYRDSVLTNHPEHPVIIRLWWRFIYHKIPVWRIRVICHTLHCVGQQIYKQIVVQTIDTDVLIRLILYLGGFTSYDTSAVNVYTEMINSSIFYDTGKIIAFLKLDICKVLSFFYVFTKCDIVSSFIGKESVMCGTHGSTVSTKILTPIYFQN